MQLFELVVGYVGLILVFLALSLLNDFMMPPIALEGATVAQAWQWLRWNIHAAPGQFEDSA